MVALVSAEPGGAGDNGVVRWLFLAPRDTVARNSEPMAGTLASVFLCLTATALLSAFIGTGFPPFFSSLGPAAG